MGATYRETIANIDLAVKGDRLSLRRSRASSFQMVLPIGLLGYVILLGVRLVRALFHVAWMLTVWWIMVLVIAVVCGVFYVFNRRRLLVLRDGTVRQGRKALAFGTGLRVSALEQKNGGTVLGGESPTHPLERLGVNPFFLVPSEAEWVALCVNDFLGHPRPDGVVEYPRPVG